MQVFYTSPWLPAEWVKAHGLEPRGVWFAPGPAGQPLPLAAGVCGFANTVVRWAETHPDSALLFSTHCDQLRRGFDALTPPAAARAFLFNLPTTWQTATARQLFTAELERMGRFLVDLGGRSPSARELWRTMEAYAQARSRLLQAVATLSARQSAEAIARFHWNGSADLAELPQNGCPKAALSTNSDATGRNERCGWDSRAPQADPVSLALVGGPLGKPHWGLLDSIEAAGGRVVLNATEPGERSLWDDRYFRSECADRAELLAELTRAYLGHYVDVFQRPNTRLYDWLRQRLCARGVRGIILWHYLGCDLWHTEAQSLREAFELPVLVLDAVEGANASPRSTGRLQSFLEALK